MNIEIINKELQLNEYNLSICSDNKEKLQLIIQRSYLKDMLIELLYLKVQEAA
jgi:hypothetical protein